MKDQFRPIDKDYVSRNFHDRRIGGKQHGYPNKPDEPEGGSYVMRKPKPKLPPKNPFTIALKTGAHK